MTTRSIIIRDPAVLDALFGKWERYVLVAERTTDHSTGVRTYSIDLVVPGTCWTRGAPNFTVEIKPTGDPDEVEVARQADWRPDPVSYRQPLEPPKPKLRLVEDPDTNSAPVTFDQVDECDAQVMGQLLPLIVAELDECVGVRLAGRDAQADPD
jgi:hypothetical protein